MANEPITREEIMLSAVATGESAKIEPITREEMFLAKLGGQDVETPEPITRREKLLQGIIDNGGGGTKVEGTIVITENGTYDVAAYASADVNVESAGGGDIDALIDGSITEITSNVGSVAQYRFSKSPNLTTANFPLATSIDNGAFQDCQNLLNINMPLATTIRGNVFQECYKLQSINAPSVNSLGLYAFKDCQQITHVNFPLLAEIPNYAFQGCGALVIADFALVTKIGSSAFNMSYGSSLKALLLRNTVICSLVSSTSLNGTLIAKGTGYIYVPRALVEDYKVATNWSTYALQFRALEDYTVDGTITGELDESKI